MSSPSLYHNFTRSIQWNMLEALVDYGILLLHQYLLFQTASSHLYGTIGTVFATIYLMATIMSFGLESTLTPFLVEWSRNQATFRRFFLLNAIPSLISGALFIFVLFYLHYSIHFLRSLFPLDLSLRIIITAIIFLEIIKRALKKILQLVFKNEISAPAEMGTLLLYALIFWSFFSLGYQISLYLALVPLLITTIVSMLILMYGVSQWYQTLPASETASPPPITQAVQLGRIAKSRCFAYIHQLTRTLFSSNFLIPFFAVHVSVEVAGSITLVSSIAHAITKIVEKIFGNSSSALLANIKQGGLDVKQHYFSLINGQLHQLLYSIIIFCGINFNKIAVFYQKTDPRSFTFLFFILCFLIYFMEGFIIIYEKLCIAEERAELLLLINGITLGLMATMLYSLSHAQHVTILLAAVAIRIISFCILGFAAFIFWGVRPPTQINYSVLVLALVVAVTFFYLF